MAPRLPGMVAAILCLGCAPGEDAAIPTPTEFPLAYYHDDCAPWDGHAVTIVLTHAELVTPFEARFPFVRVTSFQPPAELAGTSFEWSGTAHDLGYATWCESEEECSTAASVRVHFDREQRSPGVLTGDVHLEFEGGRVVSGSFEAVRLEAQILCG